MSWREGMKNNINTVEGLLPYFQFDEEEQRQMEKIIAEFPLSVTPYYLSLIDFSDENDPIKKMAVPTLAETDVSGSFDTSGEADNTVMNGLQHKYPETAMVISTNHCAMYCRHCFRRRFVGYSDSEVIQNIDDILSYIRDHKEITNVLISGGDALLNSNQKLYKLLSELVDIGHIDAIRIASRLPVVFPDRIVLDRELQEMFRGYAAQKQLFLITQYNHPREFTQESIASIRCIQKLGISVKNQTVLLQGINDYSDVLSELLRKLIQNGIDPYYVFQCRPVKGVKTQFQVPLRRGWEIVEQAKAKQNGLGKSFRYCMSHTTGKLEIVGPLNDREMLFKYHEASKTSDLGRIFSVSISPEQTWLDDGVDYC